MTEAHWLSADEQRIWRTYLLANRLLWGRFERDVQRDAGMPLTYYEILSVLSAQPTRQLRMNELADLLQISPSRLSHAVDRMSASGWVCRAPYPADRRGWLVCLTSDGFAVLEAAAPHHVESVRRHLFDQLSHDDLEHLARISERLLEHLAPAISPETLERLFPPEEPS